MAVVAGYKKWPTLMNCNVHTALHLRRQENYLAKWPRFSLSIGSAGIGRRRLFRCKAREMNRAKARASYGSLWQSVATPGISQGLPRGDTRESVKPKKQS